MEISHFFDFLENVQENDLDYLINNIIIPADI